jgi:hypothetical protein
MDSTAGTGTRIEIPEGSLITMVFLDRFRGLETLKGARSGHSCTLTFPLGEGLRRAEGRLADLRVGNIRSLAPVNTFGPNLGSFWGREPRHR